MDCEKRFNSAKDLIKNIADPTRDNYIIIKFIVFCLAEILGKDTIYFMLDEWEDYNQTTDDTDHCSVN